VLPLAAALFPLQTNYFLSAVVASLLISLLLLCASDIRGGLSYHETFEEIIF
jgi:hypothetical protein